MKKKTQKNVLNRLTKSIQSRKNQHKNNTQNVDSGKHTTERYADPKNLQSKVESGTLEEFMELANLSKKKFYAVKDQVIVSNNEDLIERNQTSKIFLNNVMKDSEIKVEDLKPLSIPRRPKWNEKIAPKEFDRLERESFLNWRRSLAIEEEKNISLVITPFEKNLEVWRQLWLVIEKSDMLVQIVDARNSNFFRCQDLEVIIKEAGNKDYFLLINKADLLTDKMRKHWADFFIEKGVNYCFFSALFEQKKIEEAFPNTENILNELKKNEEEDDEEEEKEKDYNMFRNLNARAEDIDEDEDEKLNEEEEEDEEIEEDNEENLEIKEDETNKKKEENVELTKDCVPEEKVIPSEKGNTEENKLENKVQIIRTDIEISEFSNDETIKILNREELIKLFKMKLQNKPKSVPNSSYNIVGFVGYPNVGKSSVINVLMNKKKVSVACMPGKTKHFQTLFIEDNKDLCLMDCPGLVFPSFTFSKAEMYCNGVLPIDQITEYLSPVALIIQRIPKKNLEVHYKIKLPDIYSASQFLQIYAKKRGFFTGRALPNEAKAARLVLKDYVQGNLLYVHSRPDYDKNKHSECQHYQILPEENYEEDKENQEIIKQIPENFDDNLEKLGIEVGENKKVIEFNQIDEEFFAEKNNIPKDFKITKDIRRVLKFAMKRGDITEDEYENILVGVDVENILKKLEKGDKKASKSLVQIEVNKK